MNKIIVIGSGKYPDISAGAKRIELYFKCFEINNFEYEYRSISNILSNRIFAVFGKYFLNPFYFLFVSIKSLKRKDVLILYFRGWMSILLVSTFAKLIGAKVVLEINEMPYSFALGSTGVSLIFKKFNKFCFNYLSLIFKKFNKFCFNYLTIPSLDGFIAISNNLLKYVDKYKSKDAVSIKIPILIDLNANVYQKSKYVETTELSKPYVIHIGSISEYKEGVIGIFKALALVNVHLKPKLNIYFTEKQIPNFEAKEINNIIVQENLRDNVFFIGKLSEPDLSYMLKNSSLAISFKPENEQNKHNFATKIGEIVRNRVPLIYTDVGEVTNYFEDKISGMKVPPGNFVTLAKVIKYLLDNNRVRETISSNAYTLAQREFDYLNYIQTFKAFFKLLNDK